MSEFGSELLPQHNDLLLQSAIAPAVARARGYRSVTDTMTLSELGFAPSQRITPALLVPIHGVRGAVILHQLRPDRPRLNKHGKPLKYETPQGAHMVLDVPPSVQPHLADPTVSLFITEGARKADAAASRNLCCISLLGVWSWRGTNEHGGKTALADWESVALNGRAVYIVFDSDMTTKPAVQAAVRRLREFLKSRGAIVTVLYLPVGRDGAKQGLDDYFAAGGSVEDLLTFTKDAEQASPIGTGEQPPGNRPELDCDVGDLNEITRQAWGVIESGNAPAQLFVYGSMPSRVELDEDGGSLRIIELTPDRLRHHAAKLARWSRRKKAESSRKECRPPMDIIKNMLAAPKIPLPVLHRIVEVPVFPASGALVQHPGYDSTARIYYQPYSPSLNLSVPAAPTSMDLVAARARLDEVLGDFPFVSEADKAHAVALAIVPFVRDLIDGPTPLHVAEAACPGSGKTLLVEVLLNPSVGRRIGVIAEAREDDEWRKRLTARLREGCPITLIDNLSRPLDSGTVSAVLTARRWEDRLLGKSETISIPVRTIFVATANNPVLSMEIARRSIRIRLDPKMDRPWLRDGFRHPDLRMFVEQERPALITAILTLVQGWLKAGRPKPAARPLGSFEAWSAIVGGIVEFSGFKNFLGNALEFYEEADSEGMIWRLFVGSWWETHQGGTVSVKDLFDIATTIDGFHLGRGSSERGQRTVLGQSLKKHRDQIVGGFRIQQTGTYGNGTQWRLQQITSSTPEPESVEGVEEITLK